MRTQVALGRGGQERVAHPPRPAVPACGHACAAVREAGPAGVAVRAADWFRRHVGEVDVERVAGGHPGRGPGAGDRGKVVRADREQPVAVRGRGGHQCVSDRASPGAVRLGAVKPPAARGLPGGQPGAGRLRGPHAPAACVRPGGGRTEFDQDGQGIGVPFGQPSQGQVFLRQLREDGPPLAGPSATGQRQVQPPRLDRLREGRSDPGTRPGTSIIVYRQRRRHGQQMSGIDHLYPPRGSFAARCRTRQTLDCATTVTRLAQQASFGSKIFSYRTGVLRAPEQRQLVVG